MGWAGMVSILWFFFLSFQMICHLSFRLLFHAWKMVFSTKLWHKHWRQTREGCYLALGGCWVVVGGVRLLLVVSSVLVVAYSGRRRRRKVDGWAYKKTMFFCLFSLPIFSLATARNSPIFTEDDKEVWGVSLAWILNLDSNRKDPNHWPKVTITDCKTGL